MIRYVDIEGNVREITAIHRVNADMSVTDLTSVQTKLGIIWQGIHSVFGSGLWRSLLTWSEEKETWKE